MSAHRREGATLQDDLATGFKPFDKHKEKCPGGNWSDGGARGTLLPLRSVHWAGFCLSVCSMHLNVYKKWPVMFLWRWCELPTVLFHLRGYLNLKCLQTPTQNSESLEKVQRGWRDNIITLQNKYEKCSVNISRGDLGNTGDRTRRFRN